MKKGKKDKIEHRIPGTAYNSQGNTSDFAINHKILLALQLSGLGQMEVRIIPGMLNLVHIVMANRVTEIYTWKGHPQDW
jgi:hypothetical protein